MSDTPFDRLKNKLAHRKGKRHVDNPAALAAWIGRHVLGKAEFQRRAAAGRRKAS